MTSMDITDLADTLYSTIGKLTRRQISGPVYVTRGDEQVAVIIRSQPYAPKLHHFQQDENGWLTCHQCPEPTTLSARPLNLAEALDTANQHWADNHREQK